MRKSNGNSRHGFQNNLVGTGARRFAIHRPVHRAGQSVRRGIFPQLGRVVPEENDETIREIIFRSYRIIYKVMAEKEIVAIARVWHGARGDPEIPSRLKF
jgi:plasmid stabilization system protein ParE